MENIEEAGKSNELEVVHGKHEYVAKNPVYEFVIDGKTIRGFDFRSEAIAWAVHNEPTFAYYHSGLWEVYGLDEDGFEKVVSYTGDPFEDKVRARILGDYDVRI
ncbi:MAG: hypothetical protein COA79_10055 [Planctomycetota bacterium]|nr:MAG: hypothetical protein COA79_10055 [Planctomycetota bacterium]